jgi:geranylgeranyl transferase type-2 subunit alpha
MPLDRILLLLRFHGFDARNFHCWNYRRWAAGAAGQGGQEAELAYSLRRIREDFSNYSAWHARSLAVGRALESGGEDSEALIAGEWELLFNGLYTNPQDQSLWMYVFWLLPRTASSAQLSQLGAHCLQLLEMDGDEAGRWPLLCLLRLALLRDIACGPRDRHALAAVLERIDPQRRGYYRHIMNNVKN